MFDLRARFQLDSDVVQAKYRQLRMAQYSQMAALTYLSLLQGLHKSRIQIRKHPQPIHVKI